MREVFSSAVLRNHSYNDLGVWYDDRSVYLVLHKGFEVCTGAP